MLCEKAKVKTNKQRVVQQSEEILRGTILTVVNLPSSQRETEKVMDVKFNLPSH